MNEMTNKLGERLLKSGYIKEEELKSALKHQKEEGGMIGDILVRYGFISSYDLSDFIYTNQSSKFGEILIEEKLINMDQLNDVLEYQREFGGRIGDICISKGYIENEQIEAIINKRKKEKKKLGQMLLEKEIISSEQLSNAIDMQKRSGGRLGEILLYLGYIDEKTLYREIATQEEMGRIGEKINLNHLRNISYKIASKYSAIVIQEREDSCIIGVKNKLNTDEIIDVETYLGKKVEQVLTTEEEMNRIWEIRFRNIQKQKSVFDLYNRQPENSAIVTFTSPQLIAILLIGIVILIGVINNWRITLFAINIFFQTIYAVMTISKLYIVLKGERNNIQLRFSENDIKNIDEKDLPIYTILIPVYKETEVIKKLLKNIEAIDYPKYKLDVRILLEEDDKETINVIRNMNLPSNYTVIIVPKSQPQTKPKACNYGLIRAKGEYVVIYDAEDKPEPDQLKKAYLAFKSLPDEYVCIQAKLNYFNSNQNFLTKLFTQEYSMWFELLLVGIMQMNIPIPLGGTSNHFKAVFLKELGGWDPFNVTEDADLGIRLFKFRYKTAILDSRTWEEANSNVFNWIRQRSRWIKGYMQTWLVHMRHPIELFKNIGLEGFMGYQAMILGTPLLPLINPIFWGLLVLWYTTHAGWIQGLFPGIFYYIAAFQLLFGNFMFTYVNIVGMYHVIRDCALKEKQCFSYGLIKYALLTPIYWILMSIASYKALFQLIKNPFYWEKTNHGLVEEEMEVNDASI